MMTALGQAQGPAECGTLWSCMVGSAEERHGVEESVTKKNTWGFEADEFQALISMTNKYL